MRFGVTSLVDPDLWPLVEPSRAFYAGRPAGRGPRDAVAVRAVRAAAPTPVPVDPPPVTELVEAGGRCVPVRIHHPVGAPRGVFLEFHGGGFYAGTAAGSDARNRRLADTLGIAVVSVDYRLAPEQPWPAAPDDGETAARWLVAHAASRFGTTSLAVGGFSAGATLAVTTLLRLRERGVTPFAAAVLEFGTYDLSAQTPAGRRIADEYFLAAYVGHVADRTLPDVSPVFADLAGLPPVLLVVGDADVLLEDNLAMAARLATAGVDVDLRVHPGMPHGFTGHPTPMAAAAVGYADGWLADRFRS